MTKVQFGLVSREGDRLGHLVRGIQMLRSYGRECDIDTYSDVVNAEQGRGEQPLLCCVISGTTEANFEALKGICRETQWALGDEDEVLRVSVLQCGDRRFDDPADAVLCKVADGQMEKGMTILLPADEFEKICGWGQQLTDADAPVIGEWPSATGR